VNLIGGLASLMGPPLATAATIADKISDGLDAVVSGSGDQPVLALHATLVAAGGGGATLRPGHLVVLSVPESELAGEPVVRDGRLRLRTGDQESAPTGLDFLVVRVECRTERDDWRFPDLDTTIRMAGEAFIRGHHDTFEDLRKDAIARAWTSPDLTAADRKRVALLVADEMNMLAGLGVVPRPEQTLHEAAVKRLAHVEDPRLSGLTLDQLLVPTEAQLH
jgi:hypothetical protein